MKKVIGFSGHRDCVTSVETLDGIRLMYSDALWIHGGARDGFDAQVQNYIKRYNLKHEIIRPDYDKYPPNLAPLKRNDLIVDRCDVLFICYDGRKIGGTYYTMNSAKRKNKIVINLPFFEFT